jgi:Fe-S oxidoreductase
VRVADWACGGAVDVVDACCGLPLLLAGDAGGFERAARAFAERVRGADRLVVHDAGCALALRIRYAERGVALKHVPALLVEEVAESTTGLSELPAVPGAVRYHDPCQLGRGLGVYEAPRTILARLLGRPPDEFVHARDRALCSGGGGLLPLTHAAIAEEIAEARLQEHARSGGGVVVTACASSLSAMRKRGHDVDDIATWIERGLPDARPRPVSSG